METAARPLNREAALEITSQTAVNPPKEPWDHRAFRIIFLVGVVLLARPNAAPATNHSPVVVWDVSARAEVGGGYRQNVLLTSVAPENSPFVSFAADASFIRLSETGSEFTMFFLGEDKQYSDVPSVNGERFASGMAQFARPLGARDKWGIELSSLYQNQVMDVSETETNLTRILVEGVSVTLKPNWTHTLGPGWETRLEGFGGPQLYGGQVDSYWEAGGKLSLARMYGHKSELSGGAQFAHWIYIDREQNDLQGNPVPGTALTFWRPEVFAQWRHNWDSQRRWTTTTRVGWLQNLDNGSGYWNYDRLGLSQKLRWRQAGWEIAGGARLGWYLYRVQSVGAEHRQRSYVTLDVRVERRLSKHCFAYASGESDWNWSNQSLDQYSDWMAGAGMGIEF
jgi:hypothetical protein